MDLWRLFLKGIRYPFLMAFFVLVDLSLGIYAIVQYYHNNDGLSLVAGIILIIGPIIILVSNFLLQRSKKT
jgi:hypothetical protein